MNISNHISYVEVTRSDMAKRLGISNIPSVEQLENIKILAEKVFEPIREHFNVPVYISSFFRSKELNKKLKGASSSQHLANNGAAMDIDADIFGGITNKEIFNYIKDHLGFDQLILENVSSDGTGGWIHCSYVDEDKNRNQVLIMTIKNGKKYYEKYV